LDASAGDRFERFLLILAGACLVATVIFAKAGLAIIRNPRASRGPGPGEREVVLSYDPELAIVASWDDFTEQ
jgi:hypothetical protein